MSRGKHAPARFSHYAGAHFKDLHSLAHGGFVETGYDLSFEPAPDGFLLEGELTCAGQIVIAIHKITTIVDDDDPTDPWVQTSFYSYNVSLRGRGNIFRYDSPDKTGGTGHHAHHHLHRYNVLEGDTEGSISLIRDEENVPSLGDVVREAQAWYYENMHRLQHSV